MQPLQSNTSQRMHTIGMVGFTLIELLVVVSVIGILASTAVPNLLSGKSTASEKVVVATMRTVASAQIQFRSLGFVDENRNGAPEFATLGELSGTTPLRSDGFTLDPNLLSVSMGNQDAQGRHLRDGYLIAMYLPDASGEGLAELPANISNIEPTLAENYFTLLAWPVNNHMAKVTYFTNQRGDVLSCRDAAYFGNNAPPPGAALIGTGSPAQIISQELAVGVAGADGNIWRPIH